MKVASPQSRPTFALRLYGQRPTPDYRNACKEAISAVESAARLLAGTPSLEQALDTLGPRIGLHGAMKRGGLTLYGFTSDSNGIRHALLDQPMIEHADALYMIASCSRSSIGF
jgi:hypothetical protein